MGGIIIIKIDEKKLKDYAAKLMSKAGVPEDEAVILADSMVTANLRGVDTHGVTRIATYIKRLNSGVVKASTNIKIIEEGPGFVLLDAGNGWGQVVGLRAMNICIEKAKETGVGLAGVRLSNHFGIASYFSLKAVEEDMLGFAVTNTSPSMAPWGGKEALFGTNPITVAIPAGKHKPIVLDMATSIVSRGKIMSAEKAGRKIPENWALDQEGNPVTDPSEALKGTVIPIGGPKGYGLALVVDVLAGVLTGALFGRKVPSMIKDFENPQDTGHFFAVIDVGKFIGRELFKKRIDDLIDQIKDTTPVANVKEVFVPGEIEFNIEKKRREEGIPLPGEVAEELVDLARYYGVAVPY